MPEGLDFPKFRPYARVAYSVISPKTALNLHFHRVVEIEYYRYRIIYGDKGENRRSAKCSGKSYTTRARVALRYGFRRAAKQNVE